MSERLRILLLAANPLDSQRLRLEDEHRLLRNMMHDNAEAGNCELLVQLAARSHELLSSLISFKPHIVHFAGHGNSDGICMEDDQGRTQVMSKEQLSTLFALSLKHLRLVVLNACCSAPQMERLGQLVDYVVVTDAPITDDAAVHFTADFYLSLAVGSTVREAFHQAQGKPPTGVENEKVGHYKLFIRPGADETKPLLPPFTNNSIKAEFVETDARKAVFANRVRKGPDAFSSPDEQRPNERNELEVKSDRLTADELYVANDMRETN